jgi:hypothetical protein
VVTLTAGARSSKGPSRNESIVDRRADVPAPQQHQPDRRDEGHPERGAGDDVRQRVARHGERLLSARAAAEGSGDLRNDSGPLQRGRAGLPASEALGEPERALQQNERPRRDREPWKTVPEEHRREADHPHVPLRRRPVFGHLLQRVDPERVGQRGEDRVADCDPGIRGDDVADEDGDRRISVDLPAPLRPSRPNMPGGTSRETLFSAWVPFA